MKCIERNTGVFTRVSEDLAEKLVKSGMAKYVTKQVWKKQVRNVERVKPVEVVAVSEPNLASTILAVPKEKIKIKAKDRKKKERKSKNS